MGMLTLHISNLDAGLSIAELTIAVASTTQGLSAYSVRITP
jgi:hypothetical protein